VRYHIPMKRKSPATERKLRQAAKRALSRENLVNDATGNAAKPISLHPLKLDAAMAALLKVKPELKPQK
jgi:hypothetical protein